MSDKTRAAIAKREVAKAPQEEKRGRKAEQGNAGGQAPVSEPATPAEGAEG